MTVRLMMTENLGLTEAYAYDLPEAWLLLYLCWYANDNTGGRDRPADDHPRTPDTESVTAWRDVT